MESNNNRLFVRNRAEWEKLCSQNYYSDRELTVTTAKNAIVLPTKIIDDSKGILKGGICDENFHFLAGFSRYGKNVPGYTAITSSYSVDKSDIAVRDETVIFGGVLFGHFGHIILECMNRLWWCIENPDCNFKIVFTTLWSKKDWIMDFFTLLDIQHDRIMFIDQPTQFKEIIIPEESVYGWKEYTDKYLVPHKKLIQNSIINYKKKISKVYLTRRLYSGAPRLKYCNEIYFENFYKKQGYEIISPELLPLNEQIALIANADEIATTLGTLSHLAVFAKPGTKFTILIRVSDQILIPQCLINQATQIDYFFVDPSMNYLFSNRVQGVVLFGTSECWKSYVENYFKEKWDEKNNTTPEVFWNYLLEWVSFYSNPKKYSQIANWKIFDMLNQINNVLFGRTLDKKQFPIQDLNAELNQKEKLLQEERFYLSQTKEEWTRTQQTSKQIIETYSKIIDSILNAKRDVINCEQLHHAAIEKLTKPTIAYSTHLSGTGWIQLVKEGQISGIQGQNKKIEAIQIQRVDSSENIVCAVYVKGLGWTDWKSNKEFAGTVGKGLPIQSFKVKFSTPEKNYRISYRAFHSELSWSSWHCDGEETNTFHYPALEAIQIKIDEIQDEFQSCQLQLEQVAINHKNQIDNILTENEELTKTNEFLKGKISVYTENIEDYKATFEYKNAQIEKLSLQKISLQKEQAQLIENQNRLQKQKQQLTEEQNRLLEQKQQLMEERNLLLEQKQQLTEERNLLLEQKQQLTQEKETMINSLSWRITKFLRRK